MHASLPSSDHHQPPLDKATTIDGDGLTRSPTSSSSTTHTHVDPTSTLPQSSTIVSGVSSWISKTLSLSASPTNGGSILAKTVEADRAFEDEEEEDEDEEEEDEPTTRLGGSFPTSAVKVNKARSDSGRSMTPSIRLQPSSPEQPDLLLSPSTPLPLPHPPPPPTSPSSTSATVSAAAKRMAKHMSLPSTTSSSSSPSSSSAGVFPPPLAREVDSRRTSTPPLSPPNKLHKSHPSITVPIPSSSSSSNNSNNQSFLSFLPSLSLPSLSSILPTKMPHLSFGPIDEEPISSDFQVGEAVGRGVWDESGRPRSGTAASGGGMKGERASIDLRLEEALGNGQTYSDTQPSSPTANGTTTSTSTSPPTLHRTPSSAFIAASQAGKVNPLTMAAIARKGSEVDAMRVFRERETRERELDQGGGAGSVEGGGRPGMGGRKSSWGPGLVGASSGGGRESPTFGGSKKRDSVESSKTVKTAGGPSSTPSTTLTTTISPLATTQQQRTSSSQPPPNRPSTAPGFTSSSSTLPKPISTPNPDSPTRKPSLFKRLRNRNVSSSTPAGTGTTTSAISTGGDSLKDKEVLPSVLVSPVPSSVGVSAGGAEMNGRRTSVVTLPNGNSNGSGVEPPATGKGKEKEKEKIRYMKVKTKNKHTKDFGHLFLAQELFIPSPSQPSSSSSISPPHPPQASSTLNASSAAAPPLDQHHPNTSTASFHSHTSSNIGGPAKEPGSTGGATGPAERPSLAGTKKNAVWSIKFSVDGKYLAVGGKDGVVRVWQVLSTPEERLSASSSPTSTPSNLEDHPSSPFVPPSTSTSPTIPPQSPPPSATTTSSSATPTKKKGSEKEKDKEKEKKVPVSVMPVFGSKPLHEFRGHEADVLDLSWSKNNFLLSSSMDKTVRLWHVSRTECLCAFQHLDFVTSIAFHPKDDRFFLSGSLDCKLRLWNIPEKRVHVWTELPELITSVAFTSDGKLAVAGSFVGICMFFDVSTFRYHAQFAAKSSRGKNSKGRKITSMLSMPLPSSGGERLLVTSNDSRMRLYHITEKAVEMKYAGHENTSSQIRGSFSDDARFVISGSEDRHVYIWDSGIAAKPDGGWHFKKKDGAGYESFTMAANIITCASFAPSLTHKVLAHSNDPIFSSPHHHLSPLRETLSGASLAAFPSTAGGPPLVSVSSVDGTTQAAAENSIIIVADDQTGVVSVLRNSLVPETVGGKLSKRRGSGKSEG